MPATPEIPTTSRSVAVRRAWMVFEGKRKGAVRLRFPRSRDALCRSVEATIANGRVAKSTRPRLRKCRRASYFPSRKHRKIFRSYWDRD